MTERAETEGVVRIHALSDTALTVVFGDTVDGAVHARVMGLAQALESAGKNPALQGVSEWVASFAALTVYFDPDITDVLTLEAELARMAKDGKSAVLAGRRWRLPACFEADFAPDLDGVAALGGVSLEAARHALVAATYRVYTIGFLPGFPYMGGVPDLLQVPRLTTPRTQVPARSIAITGAMCAAYPFVSPGGWHLVGRTPLPLFDAQREASPALLRAGDTVCWTPVDRATFDALETQAAAGQLDLNAFVEHAA